MKQTGGVREEHRLVGRYHKWGDLQSPPLPIVGLVVDKAQHARLDRGGWVNRKGPQRIPAFF